MYTFREVIVLIAASGALGWLLNGLWQAAQSPEFRRDLERLREQRLRRKIARKG